MKTYYQSVSVIKLSSGNIEDNITIVKQIFIEKSDSDLFLNTRITYCTFHYSIVRYISTS